MRVKQSLLRTLVVVLIVVAIGGATTTMATGTAPVNGKYSTYAYVAASRQGSAVYVNGLVKQDYSTGLIRSHGRTIYLQRNINGTWQTMLSRVTDWYGNFTVGFVEVGTYQYRYVVTESGSAWGTTSGAATPPVDVVTFANCTDLTHYYPHGVGKSGAVDHVRGSTKPVTTFFVSTNLYYANANSDADNDGIACERA